MNLENNSTTIILAFLSLITLITGFWFYFNPPKKINMFYGYRTRNSIKSQKHWDFAHVYSGKLFIIYGIILSLCAIAVNLLNLNNNLGNLIVVILFTIGFFLIIITTEKSIIKKIKN